MSTVCNCHGMIYLDCPNYRAAQSFPKPKVDPTPTPSGAQCPKCGGEMLKSGNGLAATYYCSNRNIGCKAEPAQPAGHDPMKASEPTALELKLAETWLKAYAKRTDLHHYSEGELQGMKYVAAAYATWRLPSPYDLAGMKKAAEKRKR